ncbi:MAG TPA: tetratricopeptide repeat protein [Armatimonadetes bacterium]|nr:tetratricopeptide repeat protein [Armatimonadota bacterium]
MRAWLLVMLFWGALPSGARAGEVPPKRVAVLDFASAKEDLRWLGVGFAETLSHRLATLPQLLVTERRRIRELLRSRPLTNLEEAFLAAQDVAHLLHTKYVIIGEVSRHREGYCFTAQLVRPATGQKGEKHQHRGVLGDLFAIQADLGLQLVQDLGLRLGDQERKRFRAFLPTENPLAFEFYSQGLLVYDPENPQEALGIWEQALAYDPNFALLHEMLGLAAYRYQQILYERALEEYRRALALNPESAFAHYLLGVAYADRRQYDDALRELLQAVQLNPNYVDAYYRLGGVYLTGKHRYRDAIAAYQSVLRLDPEHLGALNNLGVAYYFRGYRDLAVQQWERVLQLDPDNELARGNLKRFGRR